MLLWSFCLRYRASAVNVGSQEPAGHTPAVEIRENHVHDVDSSIPLLDIHVLSTRYVSMAMMNATCVISQLKLRLK